ncbi:hypothetical protein [Roseomonas chloroacetimidivorans]|uniref:hypothetical protein n=1 Tax=Roseomonas chloroacetimidivorans TaxID=1766656 RepID=UPI003C76869F
MSAAPPIWAIAMDSPASPEPVLVPFGLTAGLPTAVVAFPVMAASDLPTLRFSDRGWTGEPDDPDAPNEHWPARILDVPAMERAIPIYPTETRRSEVNGGEVILANGDGALDNLATDWRLAGRMLEVLRGPYRAPFRAARAEFTTVARFRVAGVAAGTSKLRLPLGSAAADLTMPVSSIFAGTGDLDGTADMAGQDKPVRYGKHINVQPVQFHPGLLAYMLHDGPIQEVSAVHARGTDVTFAGDYPSWPALAAAALAEGTYATCRAAGVLRIGTPTGFLSVNFRGAAPAGFGYLGTAAGIAAHLLRAPGGIDASRAVAASFAWPAGEVRLDATGLTVAGALDRLASGVCGWWGAGLDGAFRGAVLHRPEAATPILTIQPWMLSAPPEEVPESSQGPWYRVRTTFETLGSVQTGEDVAGVVSEEYRAYLAQPYRVAPSYSIETQTRFPGAIDGPLVETAFDTFDDAEDLADELLRIFAAPRRGWQIGIRPEEAWRFWGVAEPGAVVSLVWPAVRALQGGRPLVVRAFSARGDRLTLELWG